jgi:hypothetical protein
VYSIDCLLHFLVRCGRTTRYKFSVPTPSSTQPNPLRPSTARTHRPPHFVHLLLVHTRWMGFPTTSSTHHSPATMHKCGRRDGRGFSGLSLARKYLYATMCGPQSRAWMLLFFAVRKCIGVFASPTPISAGGAYPWQPIAVM